MTTIPKIKIIFKCGTFCVFSTETHISRVTCKNIQKQTEQNLYANFLSAPMNSPNDTYASNTTYVTTHSVV